MAYRRCILLVVIALAAVGPALAADMDVRSVDFNHGSFGEDLLGGLAQKYMGAKRKVLGSSDTEDLVAWRGRMDPSTGRSYFAPSIAVNKCDGDQDCSSDLGDYPYETYLIDPTGDSNMPVLKIGYPKGSWSPSSEKPGGTLFFAYPYKVNPTSPDNPISDQSATLEYEVYFPDDFDFVKGGKLPGMSGGDKNGRGCGGGVDPNTCFSFRVMWRTDGHGEAYIYAKEGEQADFCDVFPACGGQKYPCTACNFDAGVSFGRGSFQFKRGQWQKVRIHITLNDPDENNGYLGLEYNGKLVASYDKMKWRVNENMFIQGVEISSWFGGSDQTWSPPKDTYTMIRNVKMYRTGPPTAKLTDGNARAAILETGPTTQTVFEEVMDVGV